MTMELKILFVEDVLADVELAQRNLSKGGILFQSRVVENEIDFLRALEEYCPNIVISDFNLPKFDGMSALKITLEKSPNIPFILLTGSMNEEIAVECMKTGASDYIIKEHITRLPFAVKEALKKKGIQIEKEKAELELKESEERFRSFYENISLGLYRTTIEGRVLLANPTLVEMLGYKSFEELAQRNLQEEGFEPSYNRNQFIELLETNGEIIGLESAWIRKDLSILYIRESARAIRDAEGNILYYDGTVEDITERKQAEMALKEKMDELQRFHNLTIGRELSMIELKKEVNGLLKKAGQQEKYKIVE
ncbi:MAG: PAS domain S-box protein [Ignavibacteriaceae bacterium]